MSQTVTIIILSVVIFVMGICNITYFLFKRFPIAKAPLPSTLRNPAPTPTIAPAAVPATSRVEAGAPPRHDGLPPYDVEEANIGLNQPHADRKA